jgi:hypothetical protein
MAQFTSPRPSPAKPALRKPRNPHVAPSLQRAAGRHGPTNGARRQQAQQSLKRALQRWDELSP